MRLSMISLAAAAALSAPAAQAATVQLEDLVARVRIVPEDRSDVAVEVVRRHEKLPLTIDVSGDRVTIDGGLDRRIRGCADDKGQVRVRELSGVGWDEAPEVVIRTPRAVKVRSSGAVLGEIGPSASLELSESGCSRWRIADVEGEAEIDQSGAGSLHLAATGRLDVDLSGAANIHAGQVRNGLTADLSGAGGLRVDEIAGPLRADVSGVGKVAVRSGQATNVRARVSGIGGVEFGGVAESLDASVSGIGGVRVGQVTGPVHKSVSGIGKVRIGD